MKITIVFWGLIALVPSTGRDGWVGMRFLMLNGPEDHRHSIAVERVVRRGLVRFLQPVDIDLEGCQVTLNLERPVPAKFEPRTIRPAPGRKPRIGEGMNLAWLPKMSEVASGNRASVSKDCLDGKKECQGVSGRFDLDRGSLTVCHLLHFEGPVARCGRPMRRDRFLALDHVMEFEYRLPERDAPHSDVRRAMADAVSWTVQADKATLEWSDFGDLACDDGSLVLDEKDGSIVLLVSNLAPDADHQHFQSFYDLTVERTPRENRPFPYCAGHGRWQSPGTCEEILSLWGDHVGFEDDAVEGLHVQPHNRTECDMVLFEPP